MRTVDDVLALIDRDRDWSAVLPTVLGPFEAAGTFAGATVGPGTGDNMAAALGVGLTTGDAVVSAGTSGTAYAVCATPTVDPSGAVAGFADATGQFLPLVCTLNAAKVIDAVARLLGVDHDEFDRLALAADPAVDADHLLPYFDGERTPDRPGATGMIAGAAHRRDPGAARPGGGRRRGMRTRRRTRLRCGRTLPFTAGSSWSAASPAASPSAVSSPGSSTYRSW